MSRRAKVLSALAAAVVTGFGLWQWRAWRPEHALILGLAAGALVYSAFRTVERLRGLYRDGDPWRRR